MIIREIKRNSSERDKYRADIAQRMCEERKHKKRVGKLDKHPELKEYVEDKISKDWSPEQISGRLEEFGELGNLKISHDTISM